MAFNINGYGQPPPVAPAPQDAPADHHPMPENAEATQVAQLFAQALNNEVPELMEMELMEPESELMEMEPNQNHMDIEDDHMDVE